MSNHIYRTRTTTGSGEPVVSVTWTALHDAVHSFVEMCQAAGVRLGHAELRVLLTLYMGGYRNDVFQLLTPDNQTVVSIERMTVGIPTPNER